MNPKKLSWMVNMLPAFDVTGGAGGAAVAAPPPAAAPAAAAPAPTPAASATPPLGSGDRGVFGAIKTNGAAPKAADPAAAAAPVDPAAAPATPADPNLLPVTIFGRWNKVTDVEDAIRRSQNEGLRLSDELKASKDRYEKDMRDREAAIEQTRVELEFFRKNGPFRELSKEEEEKLATEKPLEAAKYLFQKELRDRDLKAAKERREVEVRDIQRRQSEMRTIIQRQDVGRRTDKVNWPQYEELIPVASQIIELTSEPDGSGQMSSPLTGYPWSGELLYLAGLGAQYRDLLKAGKGAQTSASEAARVTSEAAAAATRGNPAAAAPAAAPAAVDEDKAYKASLLAAAPRRVFGRP